MNVPASPRTGSAETVTAAVISFRDAVYNQHQSDDKLLVMYEEVLSSISKADIIRTDRLFWNAQTEYFTGRAFQSFDDTGTVIAHYRDLRAGKFMSLKQYYSRLTDAISHYDSALKLIEEYLQYSQDSRGCRLYAETIGQMVLLKNIGFALSYGPKSRVYIAKALRADPNNSKTRILEAGEKIYSPPLFGGNPEKGIQMMMSIYDTLDIDREDEFNLISGIGYGYAAMERWEEAHLWFTKANEIYPGNVFAKGMSMLMQEYFKEGNT